MLYIYIYVIYFAQAISSCAYVADAFGCQSNNA